MSNYNTINNFLSGLELNDSKGTNIKTNTNKLKKVEDSKKEYNKEKQITNNFMCFRDINFRKHLENQTQEYNKMNSIEEDDLTERKQKFTINNKISDRNSLFSDRKPGPIFENLPMLSKSSDD